MTDAGKRDNGRVTTLADDIRAAVYDVGDDPAAVVALLAERGRPGVAKQRVYDVLRRAGRPIGKPRPVPSPGDTSRKHAAAPRPEAERRRLSSAWDAETPADQLADLEGAARGDTCARCDGPMQWTGARTMVACPACRIARRSAGAQARAAEVAEQWAPSRQRNRAPTPAERAQAEADAAEALDRIEGYREPLAKIPRSDSQRPAAIRALHYLDKLAEQYRQAQAPADIAAADAREAELVDNNAGQLDAVLTYAEQLADEADAAAERERQQPARRSGRRDRWLQLGRSANGVYEYDDDDQADAPEPLASPELPAATNAPLCEVCHKARVSRPATVRVDPFSLGGQQGHDVCEAHRRLYPADVQVVTSYAIPPSLTAWLSWARPAPALTAPSKPVADWWADYDAAQRTGGPLS